VTIFEQGRRDFQDGKAMCQHRNRIVHFHRAELHTRWGKDEPSGRRRLFGTSSRWTLGYHGPVPDVRCRGRTEFGVVAHPVAVPSDVNDVTVVDKPVDQGCSHHFIAQHLTPLLKAFVGRQYDRGLFVAARHQLDEENRAGATDGQTGLFHDERRSKAERLHPMQQAARLAGLFERGDEIAHRAIVDAPPALDRGDRQADGNVVPGNS